jgi:uncharacterized protein (DUF488 family)
MSVDTKKAANARALSAFGATVLGTGEYARTIRQGTTVTIYTIGYEKRDGEGLMSILVDQGIKALADIRQRPLSRKPDFRAATLEAACGNAGIEYQSWPELGSTENQREGLQESGDFATFARRFRAYARRTMSDTIKQLAGSAKRKPTALLCYERLHEECHRSIIAELVAGELDATIIAL